MALTGLSPEAIIEREWEHRHTLFPEQKDDELAMAFDPLTYGLFVRVEKPKKENLLLARFGFQDGRWSDRHLVQQTTAETWRDVPSGETWAWARSKVAVIGALTRMKSLNTGDIVAGLSLESEE